MCGHGEHRGGHGYGCCCGGYSFGPGMGVGPAVSFGRRFRTRQERIAWLEEYLKDLQAEAKAVEERIAEMKQAG